MQIRGFSKEKLFLCHARELNGFLSLFIYLLKVLTEIYHSIALQQVQLIGRFCQIKECSGCSRL